MTLSQIANFFAQVPLFAHLPEHDRLALAQASRATVLGKGDILFHRGQPCEGIYVVTQGQLKLSLLAANGTEKVVELIRTGQTCGEALMFLDKDYIVTASALSDTQVLHVGKAAILQGLAQDAQFARRMLAGLSRRMHGLICDIEAYSLASASQRVIGWLLSQMEREDGATRIALSTSKQVLASRLNLTPETLSRILRDLSSQGLLHVEGRTFVVPNIVALRRFGAEHESSE